jgi:hypothetical protein
LETEGTYSVLIFKKLAAREEDIIKSENNEHRGSLGGK